MITIVEVKESLLLTNKANNKLKVIITNKNVTNSFLNIYEVCF